MKMTLEFSKLTSVRSKVNVRKLYYRISFKDERNDGKQIALPKGFQAISLSFHG